jgi:hypothetical protein
VIEQQLQLESKDQLGKERQIINSCGKYLRVGVFLGKQFEVKLCIFVLMHTFFGILVS